MKWLLKWGFVIVVEDDGNEERIETEEEREGLRRLREARLSRNDAIFSVFTRT